VTVLTPFEIAADTICPAIRAAVAEKLVKEKKYTQSQAARRLGLTQQCVSNYMVGCRAMYRNLVLQGGADTLTEKIASAVIDGADELSLTLMISDACMSLLMLDELWKPATSKVLEEDAACPVCKSRNPGSCVVTEWTKSLKIQGNPVQTALRSDEYRS
jgi:predicted transcriptional regulator